MLGERTLFLRAWKITSRAGPDRFWYSNWDRRNKRWLHWEIRSSMCKYAVGSRRQLKL